MYQKCALPFTLSDSLHCEMEWAVPKCFAETHFASLAILASVQKKKVIEIYIVYIFLHLSVGTNSGHK